MEKTGHVVRIIVVLTIGLNVLGPFLVQGSNYPPNIPFARLFAHANSLEMSSVIPETVKKIIKQIQAQLCVQKSVTGGCYKHRNDIEAFNECVYVRGKSCYAKTMNLLYVCSVGCMETMAAGSRFEVEKIRGHLGVCYDSCGNY